MTGAVRYLWVLCTRTRAPLLPLAAAVFVLIGVFLDPHQDPEQAWGLTAVAACALVALLVGAILASEPPAQAEMAAVALGGRRGRVRIDATLVAFTGLGLTAVALAYPLLLRIPRPDLFVRHVHPGDVAGAAVALLACTLLGGVIGVLYAPPRVTRRSTAVAATLATVIGLVALSGPLGLLSGPVGTAQALTDAPPGRLTGDELVAALSCGFLAGAGILAGRWWADRAS